MGKEIVFSIHPTTDTSLIIRIEEVEREEKRLKWSGNKRKLFRDFLLQYSSPKDRNAINLLIDEQFSNVRKTGRRESIDTMDFSVITVSYKHAIPVLKELAATGKLYFEKKELFANFYGGADLFYVLDDSGNDSVIVTGIVKTRSKEYKLAECDLVGKGEPHWLIHGNFLHVFKEDLTWRWLSLLREKGTCQISREEGARLIEELTEEKGLGAPEFTCESKLASLPEPTPVLVLTDKTGGFANLFMNYGGKRVSTESPWEKWRNHEAEQSWKKDLLEGGYQEKKVGNSHFYCPLDKARETLQFFLELGWEVRDSQDRSIILQTDSDLAVKSGKEAVLVNGIVRYEDGEAKISDVVRAIKNDEILIPLSSGSVGLLTPDAVGNLGPGLMDGEICTGGIKIPKHDLATLQNILHGETISSVDSTLQNMKEKLQGMKGIQKILPGRNFQGILRAYQEEGVGWLSFLYGCGLHGILADDMGLGKTVQVLAFLSTIERREPVLIVMPTSLLFHWKLECAKFLPELSVAVHHGNERAALKDDLVGHDIILTSYSILRRDLDLLKDIRFSCVVLDEAQAIKNQETQAAAAVRQLDSGFRLSMTGTPVENHLGELVSQFKFLIPGLFEDLNDAMGKTAGADTEYARKIKRKVKPFILRRKKSDVDEQLPEKIEQTVWLEMHPKQRAVYDDFLRKLKQGLLKKVTEEGIGKHRMEIFEAILRLRQICCHPLLLGNAMDRETEIFSTKTEALLSDLETLLEEGQKALVFSQFTSMLNLIGNQCREREWKHATLDGSTIDRERVVRQFQEDGNSQLMLISLKAGGVGLNLTAADYVILYEPWWNEAVENQAIDRAHRIGRHHPVIAKRYVFRDSIEERMMALKQSKRKLAEDLFENNHSFDMEDLEFLLL